MSAIPSLETLLEQEATVRVNQFDFDTAWKIGSLLRERAVAEKMPVAIEVYAFGQVLFSTALSGSSSENLEWIARKRHTVLRNAHSSLYAQELNKAQGTPMSEMKFLDQQRYTDSGGSFPLLLGNGGVIGAVSVSGLPSHEDHALAIWAIQQVM